MGYLRPTAAGVVASWTKHHHRSPPSKEPGTDYRCAVGTPVHAAADGTVCDVGGSVDVATGLFLAIDLDDGRRVRYLHLWDRYRAKGDRVSRGDIVAQSGASGYGSMWGAAGPGTVGEHVHTTLFPAHAYHFGGEGTLDFEDYADESPPPFGGGGSKSVMAKGWDEMATKDEIKDAVRELLNNGRNGTAIVSYSVDNPRNGIALVGPGYWHTFTNEEFEHVYSWAPANGRSIFADLPVITPINDRHYDIIREVMTRNTAAPPVAVDVAALAGALAALDHTAPADVLQTQVEGLVTSTMLPQSDPSDLISMADVEAFSNSRLDPE